MIFISPHSKTRRRHFRSWQLLIMCHDLDLIPDNLTSCPLFLSTVLFLPSPCIVLCCLVYHPIVDR